MPNPPLFSAEWDLDLAGVIGMLCISALVIVPLTVGAALVIRDTIRGRGNWGINLKPGPCIECGTPMPMIRKPANWRQALWGGWTCPECGLELDKWGRPIEGQDAPAKWKTLRAAQEADQGERRPRQADDRIREVNDQTQRGDAP
jgi:hypothetical protein